MNKICVILPAYNEEQTIADCIIAFNKVLPMAEIVVVNNNSSDQTEEIANNILQEKKINGYIINEYRQGKGYAIRTAFSRCEADIYVMCDSDLTYPIDFVGKLLEPVISGSFDMVVGNRHSNNQYKKTNIRKFHNFGNIIVQKLINYLFNSSLTDIMSGYRVFNRKFVKNYPILVDGFQIETDMSLHALDKRFAILEVPIAYYARPEGSYSKLNTFRDGLKVIKTIFSIFSYYKPLVFFGSLSLLMFLAGIISSIPVLNDWIESGYISHLPLAILSVGLEICALLLLSVGLILNGVSFHAKFIYERNVNN
jgi:glycosyltransferase involved in cell wall biosynthesis